MGHIRWRESFAMGVAEIDRDHRRLIDLLGGVQDAMDKEDLGLCTVLLGDLLTVAREHFATEEAHLRHVRFPRIEEHAATHAMLLERAQALRTMIENSTDIWSVRSCFDEVQDFLLTDIIEADAEFRPYLSAIAET